MARVYASKYTQKMEDGSFWVENETPTGALNGSNKTFTLADSPNPVTSAELEINGQTVVYTDDFSISGSTLTTIYGYPNGTIMRIRYRVEPQ